MIATLLPDPDDKEKRDELLKRLGGTLNKTLKKKKMPSGRIEEIEAWGRQRQEETGRPPLGREEVCRQDPHLEPSRLKKAPAPLVHAVAPEVRRALRKAYFSFLTAYQRAARLLRSGMMEVEFPAGAFPPALPVRFAARSG